MNRSFQRCLLLIGLAVTLSGSSALLLHSQTGSGKPAWSWTRICLVIRDPRKTYARWRVDYETSAVKKLIRDADISLQAETDGFTCTKPLGPDGRPVRIFSKDIATRSIFSDKGTPTAVTIRIPAEWILKEQTTNASGTEMEDFALEAATKAIACGLRRITVYQSSHGMFLRVFDGEIPSRQAIDATLRRQMAMLSGL